jgi:uncharacterized protein
MKKILFELNHPAHAHLFKHAIRNLAANGHKVSVLVKEVAVLQSILDDQGIEYQSLGEKGRGLAGKFRKQLSYLSQAYRLNKQKNFDLGVGVSVTLPLLSRISSMQAIVLDDDDKKVTPLFAFFAHLNADAVLRPLALSHEGKRKNIVYYNGFHELAYLHPAVFKPDIRVLREQGLEDDETFFILRIVSLKAHHDMGKRGINKQQLNEIIDLLRQHGRIVMTREIDSVQIPGTENLKVHPARLHHLMAHAKLLISDGQTMCAEAACLGVPSVRINDFAGRLSTLEELEQKWQLSFGFNPDIFSSALRKISDLIAENRPVFQQRCKALLAGSINVNDFLVWFIENYPESLANRKEPRLH